MLKILSLTAALMGAAVFSQFPAFTQQYVQRLAGQVDALSVVVQDFDRSALEAGLGREEALQQMTGTAFLASRQTDMRATFARHTRLADNLIVIREASPTQRLLMPHRFMDRDVAKSAYADFGPSLPLSSAGALAAGAGAVVGWVLAGFVLGLIMVPVRPLLRKRKRSRNIPKRIEPVLKGQQSWDAPLSHGAAGPDTNPNKLPGFLIRP